MYNTNTNTMISLDQMRKHIESLKIKDEEKKDLITLIEPSFDFRSFLAKKYDVSATEVENMISARIASKRDELNDGLEGLDADDYINLAVTRMSKIMRDYGEENGYEHLDALELSLGKIMMLGLRQNLTNQIAYN